MVMKHVSYRIQFRVTTNDLKLNGASTTGNALVHVTSGRLGTDCHQEVRCRLLYTCNIPPMTKKSTRINRVGQGFVCVEKAGGRRVEEGRKIVHAAILGHLDGK